MKIITISREFGSGGRELGKRLADHLGFDYYDSEIITAIANNRGLDPSYVERTLANHGWQTFPLNYHITLGAPTDLHTGKIGLLLEQKKVIEEIAALGKDCIIVGRNADVLLEEYHPFNLFVCASMEAKVARCMERAPEGESLTRKELEKKIRSIDKGRSRTRELLSSSAWGQRDAYHLTVNTSDWSIKALTPVVADFALRWFER